MTTATLTETTRDRYNALNHTPEWVTKLVDEAEAAGVFSRGIQSDKRGRGTAVNVECFGYDEAQGLAVIQVRECQFRPDRFSRVRKDYYLLGHTEQGAVFAHAVDSPARSKRALASPQATVSFVLSRIWDCAEKELPHIIRQGDIALIPTRLPKSAVRLDETETILRETHRLRAERLYRDSNTLYAYRRVSLVHLRKQHATVQVYSGVYRVQEGNRAQTWSFSAPSAD